MNDNFTEFEILIGPPVHHENDFAQIDPWICRNCASYNAKKLCSKKIGIFQRHRIYTETSKVKVQLKVKYGLHWD